MPKSLIVANWKMHFTTGEASLFLHKLQEKVPAQRSTEVVLCPNMLTLQSLSLQIDKRKFKLGAQNCYYRDEGAFTGEVSAAMMRGLVDYIIVGHSERRNIFLEDNKAIACKVQAAVRNGINPILCVGETKHERTNGEAAHVLHDQVVSGLSNLTSEEIANVVIAYEPVWAIGSGDFAKVDDAVEAVKIIRKQVTALFGEAASKELRVLYGGSVDDENAGSYLAADGINGLLIGGASLHAESMAKIITKAHRLQTV